LDMAKRVTFDAHRYRVGDIVQVRWYPTGKIVEAEIKAITATNLGAMCDQVYGIRKDMGLYCNGSGAMEVDTLSLKDREQIGGLAPLRLAPTYSKEALCSRCRASTKRVTSGS
jgi:hypothetical protein